MKLPPSPAVAEPSCALEIPLTEEGLSARGLDVLGWDDVDWDKANARVDGDREPEKPSAELGFCRPGHIHAIGGFRFFAALAVMIGHFCGRFGFGDLHPALLGRGVSFFFVLSGFILTYVYHNRLNKSGILNFYFKRIVRLWPLHLVCTLYGIWLLGLAVNPMKLAVNGLLLQSWIPDSRWVFSYNGVAWSISTEMFFFFMFPFLLLGGQRRFWLKLVLVALTSFSIVFMTQPLSNDPVIASQFDLIRIVHANPLVRLLEFGLGMATAFLFLNAAVRKQVKVPRRLKNQKWRLIFDSLKECVAISSFAIFFFGYNSVRGAIYGSPWGGPMFSAWYNFAGSSIVFALIIYVFADSKGILATMMGTRLMNFLGEISYAFFLVHMIILIYHSKVDWSASELNRWLLAPCLIAMVLGLAIWLHFVVERPVRDVLMSFPKKGFWPSISAASKQVLGFGFSKPGVACFTLCLGSWLAVRAQYTPLNLTPPMYETIFATNQGVRGVRFSEKIRLMGCDAKAVSGGVELRFVWQKLASVQHFRFTHIIDQNGAVQVVPSESNSLFKQAALIQPFEETQFIPYALLEHGDRIGIGFDCSDINPETNQAYGSLPHNRAPSGDVKPHLIIVQPKGLQQIKKEIRKLKPLAVAESH